MLAVGEVEQVGDSLHLLARHEVLDALDDPLGADPERQLRHDDAAAAGAHLLDACRGADAEGATPGGIGLAHTREPEDRATPGQVGAWHEADEFVEIGVRVEHQVSRGGHDFAEIVGGHGGRHAHRDAGRAVDEECGEARGEDGGLLLTAVVVGDEVDDVLVQGFGQGEGGGSQSAFGVAHRRRTVIGRAEVAVAIDQGQAQREGLCHPDQGVVDG